jgi:succinoglycan biosynthesis protein ExoL
MRLSHLPNDDACSETVQTMTHIAFFGHDSADSAVRRRVQSFQDDGLDVTGFMMRRRDTRDVSWPNVDLGLTQDGAFLKRIRSVFSGATQAAADGALAKADVIYARNLDMLACAFLAKRKAKLDTPVIYECLDVHRLLSRRDVIGSLLRKLEGSLLRRSRGLVVSSPGFLKNHFERYFPGQYKSYLVENRLATGADYGPRAASAVSPDGAPLRIGWVGMLRCQRSLDLLAGIADALGDQVEVKLHGLPARTEIPVFEPVIDARANMSYAGRYRSPEDLAGIYEGLDVVWAGDFMEAGYNSVWLLPNRIYEGGYYATPSIAPAGTETAHWLDGHGCGFSVSEPLETELTELVRDLISNREQIRQRSNTLLGLNEKTFIQPKGAMAAIIHDVLSPTTSKK